VRRVKVHACEKVPCVNGQERVKCSYKKEEKIIKYVLTNEKSNAIIKSQIITVIITNIKQPIERRYQYGS